MNERILLVILIATAIVSLPQPAAAAPVSPSESAPALVHASSNLLSFEPLEDYGRATLTIRERGEGVVFGRTFGPHEVPRFALLDRQGQPLPDGRYVFELVMSRDPLADSFPAEAVGSRRLSGAFELRDGAMVLPQGADGLDLDIDQEILDIPILGDAIVEGSLCASDSTDCLFDLIILDSEEFDTPGFGNADVKVKDNVPEIWFEDVDADEGDFALTVEGSRFFLRDPLADTLPFTVEAGAPSDSVYVTQSGFVGINTAVPQANLHILGTEGGVLWVERNDGVTPNIRFTTSGGPATQRWLFQVNADVGVFAIRDESAGISPFRLSPGAPENSFSVAPDGNVGLGIHPNGATHPITSDTGAFLSAGGAWTNASSRTLKTGFEPIDPDAMLAKLVQLPVQRWSYEAEGPEVEHVGPVAEDFRELFGFGDGRTISTVDTAGVTMAALQGLYGLVREKEVEIAALRAEMEALKESLEP